MPAGTPECRAGDGSTRMVNEEGEAERDALVAVRDDFWATTSNKQLNFVQHVKTILALYGRGAVVVPDNVLFEGGAGETVRRKLLHESSGAIWTNSWPVSMPRTATSAHLPGTRRRTRRAAGGRSATTSWCSGTRSAWTYSGSVTRARRTRLVDRHGSVAG